ncbi:MAG TPA: hypothetical protein PK728_12755 [Bacillota bacterium]|nr:hypothetical protein [Bacillota bacterium]
MPYPFAIMRWGCNTSRIKTYLTYKDIAEKVIQKGTKGKLPEEPKVLIILTIPRGRLEYGRGSGF